MCFFQQRCNLQTRQPALEALPCSSSLASACLAANCHDLLSAVSLYLFLAPALVGSITHCIDSGCLRKMTTIHLLPVSNISTLTGLSKGSEEEEEKKSPWRGWGMQLLMAEGWNDCSQHVNLQRPFYSPVPDWQELTALRGPDLFLLVPFSTITVSLPHCQPWTPILGMVQPLWELLAPTSEQTTA